MARATKKSSKPKTQVVLVTGVPATGKTTLCQAWCSREGGRFLPLNELVELQQLYSGIDEEDMAKVVRLPALEKAANEWIKEKSKGGQQIDLGASRQSQSARPTNQNYSLLIDGHLGCEIKLKVKCVLVLRLHPDELVKRLQARGYSPAKVATNKMTELLDYCTIQAIKNYGKAKVFELDVSGFTPAQTLDAFSKFMSSAKPDPRYKPHVDWSAQLFKEVDVYQPVREGHVHPR
jgi:adenylate kinase